MIGQDYKRVVVETIKHCKDVLTEKHKEYANGRIGDSTEDQLSNFKRAAKILDKPITEAWLGMWIKHVESIIHMIEVGPVEKYSYGMWQEKITDAINYLILLQCIIDEILYGGSLTVDAEQETEDNWGASEFAHGGKLD